jgi:8-oxo-dGTP pyrophosphatase MutT (NUDIX family)
MFRKNDWIEILRQELPGEEAHLRMSPAFRGENKDKKDPLKAAVLALLYPSDGNTSLVFIKRNANKGPHSAQISFPGGAVEPGDKNLKETALRETREEIGVREKIEILGALTPLHIPVSNFMVYPFAGWTATQPKFRPEPAEVQYILEASLHDLLDPANRESEIRSHHGQSIKVPFFRVGKEKIWGATAMMLSEILQLASKLR